MSIKDYWKQGLQGTVSQQATLCHCIGPQNGEPVCPCQMRGVIVENGRYVMRRDLGPAPVARSTDRRGDA